MNNHFLQGSPNELQNVLIDANRQLQEEAAQVQARQANLPYLNLHNFPIDLQVLGLFSKEEAETAESLPFYRDVHDLRIGTRNPANQLLKQKVIELSKKYQVTLYLISKASFEQTLKFYAKVATPKSTFDETVRVEKAQDFSAILKELADEGVQQKKTASELLTDIFGAAMFFKASDIHLEPEEHFIKVRLRIDGVLQDMLHLAKGLQKSIMSRLKILSKLKINIENLPQDGRITFYYLQRPIDVRVSTLPSAYGEGTVMRLLGTGAVNLKLKDLGFQGRSHDIVEAELQKPNGMIITTGPTGSGKTTTLYAFLNELNQPGVKIITLEDPVEYKLEGIQQTPIDHTVDFDFAKGLRAILRQDPDIVMVGEIRDLETADTAMQAALTGHVVLSTLHTNDAAGAIPRLYNMGAKPFVIAPALNAVIAQRLVRRLCPKCIKPAVLSPVVLSRAKMLLEAIPPKAEVNLPKELQFYHAEGCSECHGLGYSGRIGIYEVIQVTDTVKDLIQKEVSMTDLKKQAIADGMVSMAQDGLLKALQKITDVEEVFRVAGD